LEASCSHKLLQHAVGRAALGAARRMWFLTLVLLLTTSLLCYAGYIFLVVDKRQEKQVLENPEVYEALDDKQYNFELPIEIDDYDELRESKPPDKRTLPLALLKRAMADIPLIEQLERDHPRMVRLFNRGLLPFGIWEQLLEAERMMDEEVHEVQAEAEKLQKGWGQGVFGQAYQMLRKEREEDAREAQERKGAAQLTIEFEQARPPLPSSPLPSPPWWLIRHRSVVRARDARPDASPQESGRVVTLIADGRNVLQQSQMLLRRDCAAEEVAFKSGVKATLVSGDGDDARTFSCQVDELLLDKEQEKQWKQLGQDAAQLRLQLKFTRKAQGLRTGFVLSDVRATIPPLSAGGAAASS